jgi:hypothetical protein
MDREERELIRKLSQVSCGLISTNPGTPQTFCLRKDHWGGGEGGGSNLKSKSEEPMLGADGGTDDVIVTREDQDLQLSIVAKNLFVQRDLISVKIFRWPMIPKMIAALHPFDLRVHMQGKLHFLEVEILWRM